MLTLWTIRPQTDFEILRQKGVFITDPAYVDDYHIKAYRWLSGELAKRTLPPSGVVFPVWAWYVAHHRHKPKPDLRYGGFLPKGTKGVRIEFTIAKERVLLSNFDAWHSVLNDWCYATDDKEYDHYQTLETQLSPHDFLKIKEQSWQKIFDVSSIPDDYAIQAVLWQLNYEWVTQVDYFVAR